MSWIGTDVLTYVFMRHIVMGYIPGIIYVWTHHATTLLSLVSATDESFHLHIQSSA